MLTVESDHLQTAALAAVWRRLVMAVAPDAARCAMSGRVTLVRWLIRSGAAGTGVCDRGVRAKPIDRTAADGVDRRAVAGRPTPWLTTTRRSRRWPDVSALTGTPHGKRDPVEAKVRTNDPHVWPG